MTATQAGRRAGAVEYATLMRQAQPSAVLARAGERDSGDLLGGQGVVFVERGQELVVAGYERARFVGDLRDAGPAGDCCGCGSYYQSGPVHGPCPPSLG